MNRVVHCDCGFDARAEDQDGLVIEVRRHALEAHGMELSPEDALLLAFRAGLDLEVLAPVPHKPTAREEET